MTTLNTRIKLKYDSYANWTSKNPVLLAGEVAIATVETGAVTSPSMTNLPNIVLKVGDGTHKYNELKFVSALAADVYDWAKAANKPTYVASDFTWLDSYVEDKVNSTIEDTDTQYTIQAVAGSTYKFNLMKKGKNDPDSAYVVAATIDLTEVDSRLDGLETKVGSTSVADQIAAAIQGLDLEKLESTSGSGKVLSYIQQADGIVTAEMRSLVEADIPALSISKVTNLQTSLNGKQDNLTFTEDYTAGTSVIPTQEYVDTAASNSIKINNNDAAIEGQFVTAAVQTNGEVAVSRRALKNTDFGTNVVPQAAVNGLATALAGKQNTLTFASTPSATNKVATMTEVNAVSTAITNLDMTKVEVGNGEILSSAVQEDGQVTVTKRALASADFKADLIPESAVSGLTEKLSDLDTTKQDNIVWADGHAYNASTNKAATVSYVASAVSGLNGAMHFIGKVEGETFDAAVQSLTPAAGDVIVYGYDEYVYDATNKAWIALGNESIYQTKTQAQTDHNALTQSINTKQDALGFEGTYNKSTNKVVTKSAMDSAIQTALNIDVTDTAKAGQLVSAVSQADGAITVSRRALVAGDFAANVVPQSAVNGLATALSGKQDTLTFMTAPSTTNPVATKAEIDAANSAVTGLNMTEVSATQGKIITTVKQENGLVSATTRALVAADIPTIQQSQVSGLATALSNAAKAGTDAAATAESNAKSYADEQIGTALGGLDLTDAAVDGQFVTKVNQTDGQIAVTRAAINAKHLTQTTGEYLIFDCGSASINI